MQHCCSPDECLESRISSKRSLTFTCETKYLKLSVCSSWGHDSVHAEAAPPVKAMFIEPRLICQSTFLLLRDRRSGGLSDCPSGVITFTTTHCSAAPQTPGKLPQLLTFPLEKIRVEMAATVWHYTFYFWGKVRKIPLCVWLTIYTLGLDHRLCTRTPPPPNWRGLGFCNADLWCSAWACLWWSASCWATLALMNKQSPKRRRICTKSHDWGADARLRNEIYDGFSSELQCEIPQMSLF